MATLLDHFLQQQHLDAYTGSMYMTHDFIAADKKKNQLNEAIGLEVQVEAEKSFEGHKAFLLEVDPYSINCCTVVWTNGQVSSYSIDLVQPPVFTDACTIIDRAQQLLVTFFKLASLQVKIALLSAFQERPVTLCKKEANGQEEYCTVYVEYILSDNQGIVRVRHINDMVEEAFVDDLRLMLLTDKIRHALELRSYFYRHQRVEEMMEKALRGRYQDRWKPNPYGTYLDSQQLNFKIGEKVSVDLPTDSFYGKVGVVSGIVGLVYKSPEDGGSADYYPAQRPIKVLFRQEGVTRTFSPAHLTRVFPWQ